MEPKTFKKALITGSTSKLGFEMTKMLLGHCESFFFVGRNKKALLELEDLCKGRSKSFALSLEKPEDLNALLDIIEKESPDLVINSAGLGFYGPVLSHLLKEHLDVLDVNCKALLAISYQAAKTLISKKKKGVILNVSSAADIFSYPLFSSYSSSKAFVTSFTKSFREELKGKGVDLLLSIPGPITTDFRIKASKGAFTKMDSGVSPETAASEIVLQIKQRKAIHTFPAKLRFTRNILRYFVPQPLMYFFLKRGIEKRFKK